MKNPNSVKITFWKSKRKRKSLLTLHKNVTYIMQSVFNDFTATLEGPQLTYMVVSITDKLKFSGTLKKLDLHPKLNE